MTEPTVEELVKQVDAVRASLQPGAAREAKIKEIEKQIHKVTGGPRHIIGKGNMGG